jgi:phosphatidate cytidylyltransferase
VTLGPQGTKWQDLGPRAITAAGLLTVGALAIYLGGAYFAFFGILVAAIVVWEISVIAGAVRPFLVAVAAAVAAGLLAAVPSGWALAAVALPGIAGLKNVTRVPVAHAAFCGLTVLAVWVFVDLRSHFPTVWFVWLIGVVIATDLAGYFAGRALGGPKFWPRLSPKKTWSGTCAGWIASAGVGALAAVPTGAGWALVLASVAVSVAAQLGDIGESAMKRSAGVKDSSGLLPGHGGFFDRFDGVIGAAAFLLVLDVVVGFPPGQG